MRLQFLPCIILMSLSFLAKAQTIEGTWFREGIYQLERIDIDEQAVQVYRYDNLDLGGDTLTLQPPKGQLNRTRMRILARDTTPAPVGYFVLRIHPDSVSVNVLHYQIYRPGIVSFLPTDDAFRDWETALAAGQKKPQPYEWLKGRVYVSDSLAQALRTRPSLMEVTKADVKQVLIRYNAQKPQVEVLLTRPNTPAPSRFRVTTMLRDLMNRLFMEQGYNPYKEYRVHPFSRYESDPDIKSLLDQAPETILERQ